MADKLTMEEISTNINTRFLDIMTALDEAGDVLKEIVDIDTLPDNFYKLKDISLEIEELFHKAMLEQKEFILGTCVPAVNLIKKNIADIQERYVKKVEYLSGNTSPLIVCGDKPDSTWPTIVAVEDKDNPQEIHLRVWNKEDTPAIMPKYIEEKIESINKYVEVVSAYIAKCNDIFNGQSKTLECALMLKDNDNYINEDGTINTASKEIMIETMKAANDELCYFSFHTKTLGECMDTLNSGIQMISEAMVVFTNIELEV